MGVCCYRTKCPDGTVPIDWPGGGILVRRVLIEPCKKTGEVGGFGLERTDARGHRVSREQHSHRTIAALFVCLNQLCGVLCVCVSVCLSQE